MNDVNNRISHERMINLIIFVLMDQAVLSTEWLKTHPDDENIKKMHDAILQIRENPRYMYEIETWIIDNLSYLDNPLDCTDAHYYEMIVDAMGIIYYDDYYENNPMTGSEYAELCKEKYNKEGGK